MIAGSPAGADGADRLTIRSFEPADGPAAAQLFFEAVRRGAASAYSAEERRAWAPAPPEVAAFTARIGRGEAFVAEQYDILKGFMTLDFDGGIDLAFVHPEAMGQGVGGRLLVALEAAARARGLQRLHTQASLIAEPFFSRHGFTVVKRNEIPRGGAILKNATMEKLLPSPREGCGV